MSSVQDPPWLLSAECILAWVWRGTGATSLPPGLHPLPGWAAVAAVHYTDSPIGAYLELSAAVPARLGLRPGLCVTSMVVNSAAARSACRSNWGLPAELGTLRWGVDGAERSLVWEERGIVVRGVPTGPAIPALVPVRSVQRRGDGPVVVPRRFFALTRLARVHVDVPDDDVLAWTAGPHAGAVQSGVRMVVRPARQPTGLWSSLRAPLGVPDPAVSAAASAGATTGTLRSSPGA